MDLFGTWTSRQLESSVDVDTHGARHEVLRDHDCNGAHHPTHSFACRGPSQDSSNSATSVFH